MEVYASNMDSAIEQPELDQEWTGIDFHEQQPESPTPLSQSLNEQSTSPSITESETLCQYCGHIDFDSINGLVQSLRRLRDAEMHLAISASSTHDEQLVRCVLCNFFAQISAQGLFSSPLPRYLQFSALARIRDASYLPRWIDRHGLGFSPAFYLRLLADEDIQRYGSEYAIGLDAPLAYSKLSLALPSSVMVSGERTMKDADKFVLRHVDPKAANMGLIRHWLGTCRLEHECLGEQAPILNTSSVLNVIDCKEKKVVPAPPRCEYLALSYVWGRKEVLPFDQAPQVVRDAMEVVLELNERYLWVDKYCILDVEPGMKQDQLNQMDNVYSSAYATIVAAAGKSEDHGLCGVSSQRKYAQPSVDIPATGGLKLIGEVRGTTKAIYDSVWMSRAWTLQEGLCSRRLIIFSENEVYFECGAMRCHEHTRLAEGKTGDWCEPLLGVGGRSMIQDYSDPLQNFWHTVQDYSRRHLTYSVDAMNAVRGILHRFGEPVAGLGSTSPRSLSTLFGIPLVQALKQEGDSYHTLMIRDGLCWKHTRKTSRRREGFPSWTWAGWVGLINGPWTSPPETSLSDGASICIQLKDGERKPCDFLSQANEMVIEREFECLCITMQLISIKLSVLRSIHRMFKRTTEAAPHKIPHYEMTLHIDAEDNFWDVGLLNTDPRYEPNFIILLRWKDEEKIKAERLWGGWVSEKALTEPWSEPKTILIY